MPATFDPRINSLWFQQPTESNPDAYAACIKQQFMDCEWLEHLPHQPALDTEDTPSSPAEGLLGFLADGGIVPAKHMAVFLQEFLFGGRLLGGESELLQPLRKKIQERLISLGSILTGHQQTESSQQWAKIHINSLLSLLPYTNLKDLDKVTVPVMVKGKWKLVNYSVENLELSPRWFSSPYCASGLTPTDEPDAPALLLYSGARLPGHSGHLWTALNIPTALSTGLLAFNLGYKVIKPWLERAQKNRPKVQCHGLSLGGTMVIYTALHFPRLVDGFASVPAGLSASAKIDTILEIYTKGQDPVSRVGVMPSGNNVRYYYELPSELSPQSYGTQHNTLSEILSHVLMLSNQKGTKLYQVNHSFFELAPGKRKWNFIANSHLLTWPLAIIYAKYSLNPTALYQWVIDCYKDDTAMGPSDSLLTQFEGTPDVTAQESTPKLSLSPKPS